MCASTAEQKVKMTCIGDRLSSAMRTEGTTFWKASLNEGNGTSKYSLLHSVWSQWSAPQKGNLPCIFPVRLTFCCTRVASFPCAFVAEHDALQLWELLSLQADRRGSWACAAGCDN